MNYQDILDSCHEPTVGQLVGRHPQPLDEFLKYVLEIEVHRAINNETEASDAEPMRMYQELFNTAEEQAPVEALDSDVLLELILQGYDVGHFAKLSSPLRSKLSSGRVLMFQKAFHWPSRIWNKLIPTT